MTAGEESTKVQLTTGGMAVSSNLCPLSQVGQGAEPRSVSNY